MTISSKEQWARTYPGGEPFWDESGNFWNTPEDRRAEQVNYASLLRSLGVQDVPQLRWFKRVVTVELSEPEEVVDPPAPLGGPSDLNSETPAPEEEA